MTPKEFLMLARLLRPENYVSIRQLQKSPSKVLSEWEFKIVINNWKPIWIFLSLEEFEKILEEYELLQDEEYLKDIEEARAEKEFIPAEEVWKKAGLI